jgi:bifunctional DNA-binding transcriptional regulator/antitoxin component of YhaV-PrlF toxin-antitoxin module
MGSAKTIKLTSKRQATFPHEVCKNLGLQPGDEIELIPRMEDGEQVWMLHKRVAPARPWIGSLSAFAQNVDDHSMEAIRTSIAQGRPSDS